ncbi:MAG: hypothetical protein UY16_C0007G0016 [Candidatus Gottesmanbacteria bacterium GW2011_GWA2_47_9]|uniref:Uncharacterized protein n=1 Tax=Candidatus Gottesmanbacteria bacterium GW2011_GWA2_47_9 TaxID=1618445 RepID=A0A0G1X1W6_9BACT|nr:MAG: hypothetical protein UY16_C0007G0016 [Candidatus Gottesmanbacteria bacterium GW2011_GWA2_47_9]
MWFYVFAVVVLLIFFWNFYQTARHENKLAIVPALIMAALAMVVMFVFAYIFGDGSCWIYGRCL